MADRCESVLAYVRNRSFIEYVYDEFVSNRGGPSPGDKARACRAFLPWAERDRLEQEARLARIKANVAAGYSVPE